MANNPPLLDNIQVLPPFKRHSMLLKFQTEGVLIHTFEITRSQLIADLNRTTDYTSGNSVPLPVHCKSICGLIFNSRSFADFHQIDKVIEHRCHIVGAGARFRMSLEAEGRLVGAMDTLQGTVEE